MRIAHGDPARRPLEPARSRRLHDRFDRTCAGGARDRRHGLAWPGEPCHAASTTPEAVQDSRHSLKITLSVIKADVGSIGGHTKPSAAMLEVIRGRVGSAIEGGLLI